MKDIIIYHPATEKYVCIDAPEIFMWEHEPLSIKNWMIFITSSLSGVTVPEREIITVIIQRRGYTIKNGGCGRDFGHRRNRR